MAHRQARNHGTRFETISAVQLGGSDAGGVLDGLRQAALEPGSRKQGGAESRGCARAANGPHQQCAPVCGSGERTYAQLLESRKGSHRGAFLGAGAAVRNFEPWLPLRLASSRREQRLSGTKVPGVRVVAALIEDPDSASRF